MDEKLREEVQKVIVNASNAISQCRTLSERNYQLREYSKDIGQAFKDAGWIEPRKPQQSAEKLSNKEFLSG